MCLGFFPPFHCCLLILPFCFNLQIANLLGIASFGVGGNETDKQALLEFKAKISSDQLGVMHLWNNSVHFCHWPGIACSRRRQRVIELDLQSWKLVGPISPFIGNLSFLKVLNLQNNSFSHEIPQEVGRLRRLQELKLSNNSIVGEIPSNISGCFKLRVIQLSNNQLVGEIPVVIGSLSNLKVVSLYHNSLSGSIPLSFGNLTSLEILSLAQNRLSSAIPETLDQLSNLTFFSVAENELSGLVPSSLFNLSNLETLDIGSNRIQGTLPWDLGFTIPSLEILAVSNNQLTGTLPASISNASNLLQLEVVLNKFTGNLPSFDKLEKLQWFAIAGNLLGSRGADDLNFLCTLTNATDLQVLNMNKNAFGGIIPECIRNLSINLEIFTINNNEIWGRIPAGIGNLINLEMLTTNNNQLSGHIPPIIGVLQKLKVFDVRENSLSGCIPLSFGNLTMLINLNLGHNNFQGIIPPSLSKCKSLISLDLSNNNLIGSILPELLAGLSSLSIALDFSSNHLTGVLPTEVGNLKDLGALDVSWNMLSGVLPSTLGSCIRLEELVLGGNFFQGSIRNSLSLLRGLAVLELSHNNLSGGIPKFLGSFGSLQILNLSYNDFEGAVPTEGVFSNSSATFIQGNSKLCGGLPEFHLPRCKMSSRSRTSLPKIKIIIVSGIIGVTLVFSLLVLVWFRKKRKQSTPNYLENSPLWLSYQSILKATDGFSSANLVGAGSFGSVYKGILEENGTLLAVKVLNRLNHRASKSFIRECEALRSVRHRNLVKILTACSSVDYQGNDFKALVYEFMVHGSLEDWLHPSVGTNIAEEAPKKLEFSQRLNVAVDVACALEYLHHHCETSIVHCDLKPSNILLDDEMVGHVGDFGLAKFMSADMQNYSTSLSSSLRGTIGYVAPEYGLGNKISTCSDVYSYGILLLEMFTGKRPTDDMFKEDLNLHNYVKLALPERVAEITDPILLQEIVNHSKQRVERFLHCLISIFGIGVTCSAKSPSERMNMTNVTAELCSVRDKLLPTRLPH
ncbi:probable LRR receptor-like serine/threonine-protein kinase At3g47570 [Durio zibethinus]|uniref:non-specific serine/threonine protein kinase n=1 Tax=Durio zibethinus TaxID=66656 RepID=A0A6P6AHA1_DURZI|nr:probable LRR receptor-like serine/threonine-protein kinase At3g47570 [Durio zibethinus]